MKGVLDALLDAENGALSYKDVCMASGHANGKAALAGVLSSMTRNLKRYVKIKDKKFLIWEDDMYRIGDTGLLVPLRKAREKYKEAGN